MKLNNTDVIDPIECNEYLVNYAFEVIDRRKRQEKAARRSFLVGAISFCVATYCLATAVVQHQYASYEDQQNISATVQQKESDHGSLLDHVKKYYFKKPRE